MSQASFEPWRPRECVIPEKEWDEVVPDYDAAKRFQEAIFIINLEMQRLFRAEGRAHEI